MKLSDIIQPGAIIAPLQAGSRDAALAELIDALIASGSAPARLRAELLGATLEREKRGSTGFGKGVAVPHVKRKDVDRVSLAVGLSPRGIDFNALDKQPVHSIFLLLSPENKPEEHLKAMEVIFQRLSFDTFRRMLRQADTREHALALLNESDTPRTTG